MGEFVWKVVAMDVVGAGGVEEVVVEYERVGMEG